MSAAQGVDMIVGGLITGLVIVGLFFAMISSSPRLGR